MTLETSLPETLRLVAVCLLAALLATACSLADEADIDGLQTVAVYGLNRQPAGFDPHRHRDPVTAVVARQVYDTLLHRHPLSREFVPGLAREWSLSRDGRILDLQLRDDVRFHDGSRMDAAAVVSSLDRIVASDSEDSQLGALRERYIGTEIVDNFRVNIVLSQPWTPLLDALTQPGYAIVSPAALARWSDARYQFYQVGSGPFRFLNYIPGERVVLARNPDYSWGPDFLVLPDRGTVDTVEFRFLDDAKSRDSALQSGDIDLLDGLLPSEMRASEAAGMRTELVPVPGQPLMFHFNTARFPTSLRGLRQALIFMTNRAAIANVGGQPVAPVGWGPLSESTLYFYGNLRGLYALDRQLAHDLLEQSGIGDSDGDSWLDVEGIPLQLDILVTPADAVPQAADLLVAQWRDSGIRSSLRPVPTRAALRELVRQNDYHLVASAHQGFDPAWLGEYFGSAGASNWSRFQDDELNDLLRETLANADSRARFSMYARIQQIIMDRAIVLPLRDQVNIVAVAPGLDGLLWDTSGLIPWLHNLHFLNS
ncbi:MAG: ABC transporter substrate-binding protein [Anaerolineaceae bacterium]|nr:ABC transporter substrate-binding protein [Anaerolineaceae bacterium]